MTPFEALCEEKLWIMFLRLIVQRCVAEIFLERTIENWNELVKNLSIVYSWLRQDFVIMDFYRVWSRICREKEKLGVGEICEEELHMGSPYDLNFWERERDSEEELHIRINLSMVYLWLVFAPIYKMFRELIYSLRDNLLKQLLNNDPGNFI